MIDIQGDLKEIREKWDDTYISIYDLFLSLEENNSKLQAKDIAEYLLIKLDRVSLANIANIDKYPGFYSEQRSFSARKNEFVQKYGFPCYRKKDNYQSEIYSSSNPDLFFDFLRIIKVTNVISPTTAAALDEYDFERAQVSDVYIEKSRIKQALENIKQGNINNFSQQTTPNALSQAQEKNKINELTTENEQLKARITELEAENLSKPDIPTAESAVKSDEIKQYNHVERNTHLQIIGGLVEILAEKVGKFKHGDKINISAIAQEIDKVTVDYEDQVKERTIRARLTEALKKIGNEHTESP